MPWRIPVIVTLAKGQVNCPNIDKMSKIALCIPQQTRVITKPL